MRRIVGLGLAAGAVLLATPVRAQEPPDSVARRDSLARARVDSLIADSLMREDLRVIAEQRKLADTIKLPTPAAEMPRLMEIDRDRWIWNRDRIVDWGNLTVGDLIENVPGLSVFRSGWIRSPEQAAFMGDFTRVRLFLDGMEMDAIDPRNGGIVDLSFVQLWTLEEVRVERSAAEVRIYMRSWRVQTLTPVSRVDVSSGDLQTNLYQGFFGRRFRGGQALQVGASQSSTRDPRNIGDSDGLSLFGRFGWARGPFAFDIAATNTGRERTAQARSRSTPNRAALRPIDAKFQEAYARVAYSDTTRGLWAQFTAGRFAHEQSALLSTSNAAGSVDPDRSNDTTFRKISQRQLVSALGWDRGPLSLSFTARSRFGDSLSRTAPMARAAYESRFASAAVMVEQDNRPGVRTIEGMGALRPLPFLSFAGAISRVQVGGDTLFLNAQRTVRGEAGLRLGRTWLTAGAMQRAGATLIAPALFDTGFTAAAEGKVSGYFATVRGKVWKDVGIDVSATRWNSPAAFRPQYQTRSVLYVDSDMKARFPSGNLHIRAAVTHDYRSKALFPISGATPDSLRSTELRSLGALLEIRLIDATLFYQFRNFLADSYEWVPGYLNGGPIQLYGVRWRFFN